MMSLFKWIAAFLIAAIAGYWLLLGAGYFTLRFLLWADLIYLASLKPTSCLIVGTYLVAIYFAVVSLFQLFRVDKLKLRL